MSRSNRPHPKDMYWFAHGGPESEGSASQRNVAQVEEDEAHPSNSPTWNLGTDRKGSPEELRGLLVTDGSSSSGPSSLERDDRIRIVDKRLAVEERRKQLWEAEQERNDAVLRKHMEREAALEARRNAQRSNISFAFGSSIPRNVETLHADGRDTDIMSRSFTASGSTQKEENYDMFHDRRSVSPLNYNGYLVNNESHQSESSYSCTTYSSERRVLPPPSWLSGSGALVGDDVMSRSMNAAMACATRGRRKNDLMPTVPYERTAPSRPVTAPATRKRSVSMTRLDQLAQPRRHYVEASKANSSTGSGASSVAKDNIRSPSRPLSSASENSGGSGRVPGTVTRRVRSSPRKPRPVSIAGTLPDHKQISTKPFEVKVSPIKRSYTPSKKTTETADVRKSTQPLAKSSTPKPSKQAESKSTAEKAKSSPRPSTTPKANTPKTSTSKPTTPKSSKQTDSKLSVSKAAKSEPPKAKEKKAQPIKKKTDSVVSSPATVETIEKADITEKQNESADTPEGETIAESDRNNGKRIISEEEAKAALAEKRRLAREQAEREAELERQRQEEIRRQEEEQLRKEEEEHRKMAEEQLRLLEEHRRLEDEKLRKAIEEQEQKEEEERTKREEELRTKAEQERKAKEEAEKQRIELEEKLRKEEEERAERKKRLEKIMSRTRGKSSGTSPSGSISGSDQLDSGEQAQEGFSSGANSLDSNEAGEQASVEDNLTKAEISSAADSTEANPTYEIGSENESLNSNELMMPLSETASQDNSLVIIPEKNDTAPEPTSETTIASSVSETPETESTVVAESQVDEKLTFSQDVETKSTAIPENEETKLAAVETVEEISESTGLIAETEHELHDKNDAFENFTENQTSQDNFVIEQESGTEPNLDDHVTEVAAAEYNAQGNEFEKSEDSHEHTEDMVQFSENATGKASEELFSVNDMFQSENTNEFMLPEPSSMPSNMSFGTDAVDNRDADLSETVRGSSVSSDIKLPDPIYETSEDGSISSDRHQQYYQQEDLGYSANQDIVMSEDVFSEQAAPINTESGHQPSEAFAPSVVAESQSPFSAENSELVIQNSASSDNQFSSNFEEAGNFNMGESMYQDKLLEALEQPREIGEENVIPSRSSTSSVVEADVHLPEAELKQSDVFYQENKENFSEFSTFSSELANQNDMSTSAYGFYSDKENTVPAVETQKAFNSSVTENNQFDLGPEGDGASVNNPFSTNSELHMFQGGDFNFEQQQSFSIAEQMGKVETVLNNELSSQVEEISDVTLIKSDDNGAYVGIISSIDHDQTANDFQKPNLHNEQLKNNIEFASMTDSEENSSLDSNLSQVMTVEKSEITNEGLNHTENSAIESNLSQQIFSNGEQHNPFATDHVDYYDSNSKTNVNIFSASERSNGHSLESSRQVPDPLHGFGQLEGNDILSVDHSKNNIFENVDAIDYGKVSPDPFLGKGNSKSGNPFLLQDDQKQVLMTPDFLN